MAKLNTTKSVKVAKTLAAETTTNYEGAEAFTLKAHDRLIERVLGSFWSEDLFYTKGKDTAKDIIKDIQEVAKADPKFVLQLAAYARGFLHLRTAPQVLLVEAARIDGCKPFVREYTPKIVKRADELTEVVAYYANNYGKNEATGVTHKDFPNSLKKGLADAFKNFDEYQLNKYDSSNNDVTLGQVAKLVHPTLGKGMYNYLTRGEIDADALPKTAALKALLAKDTIDEEAKSLIGQSHVTWETLISKFGSSKETWELVAPNMGYMALLRNLRNFRDKDVDLDPILERIQDEDQVKKSKQLPFRFYSAYKELEGEQKIQRAIAQAFEKSISNVKIDGKTAIAIDLSGSMDSPLSSKSKVTYKEVAAVLGALAVKKSAESTVIGFGDSAQVISMNPDDTMITNIQKVLHTDVGISTNAWLIFDELTKEYDRVVLISDMQCYDSKSNDYYPGYGWGYNGAKPQSVSKKWKEYSKNKNTFLYSMDISAYGTKQTSSNQKNVVLLNGWSDKILDYMTLVEKRDVMAGEIRKW